MTRNSYKNLLIESAVADIKKIEVFKSPADKILDSARKGTVTDDVSDVRDAESAIAVLGRIYDAQNEDRPFIRENDDEHEAQGDSEISVDMPDCVASAKIQDIADVIDSDAGCEPNPDQDDEFKNAIADDANDNHLDENFILEDVEDNDSEDLPDDDEETLPEDDEDSDEGIAEDDDTLPEDEIEDDELPEDGDEEILPEDEEDSDEEEDECCPDCGKDPCECEDGEEDSDSDEVDEDLDEGCNCEEDDTLPADELPEDKLPEDDSESHDEDELPEDKLPEDVEEEELAEEGEPDGELDMDDAVAEDVDDSTLDETEVTGSDEILADDGDTVPAEEIPVDGDVYNEDAEDPAVDPNGETAENQAAEPAVDPNTETVPSTEAPVENQAADQTEDPAIDPNAQVDNEEDKTDPVLDVDSQVVASDTTQESVMESLIRSFKESSDEAYMNYESDDFDSED